MYLVKTLAEFTYNFGVNGRRCGARTLDQRIYAYNMAAEVSQAHTVAVNGIPAEKPNPVLTEQTYIGG